MMKRVVCVILALIILSLSAMAESAVITKNTRIYKKASTSSASLKVPKGMEVELLDTSGSWALVERQGVRAYIKKADLAEKEQEPDYDALMKNAVPAQFNASTKVYRKPSTSSASTRVSKGMKVNLLATSGSLALVESNGIYAYTKTKYLSEVETTPNLERPVTMYINADTKVYKKASTSSASLKVPKGMKVSRLSGQGDWALIQNGSAKAYIQNKYLSETDEFLVEATPTPTPAPTATPKPDYSSLLKDAKDGVFTRDGKVYESADTSSASVTVNEGTKVKLLAVKNGWALIAKGDSYGFTDEDNVSLVPEATATPKPTPTPTPKPTPTPVPENYLTSSKYTNEQKCHMFMVKEMKLSCAAACGILANMRKESNFNPTAGSSYYGLIQWGGGRLTNLKKFCSNNGYSYSTLEGQLNFLSYELEKSYSSVLKYLKGVSNTAQGAYDAAYHFCYYYERPSNKASKSASRGALARDTYFPKYS